MVLTSAFSSPTQILHGPGAISSVAGLVGTRPWGLVTSAGWLRRGVTDKLGPLANAPAFTLSDVPVNPKQSYVTEAARGLKDVGVIVAIGGGSVLDAAKGVSTLAALRGNAAVMDGHLRAQASLGDTFNPAPIIAVPTTSGTGAEVTCWATIWGDDGAKYSLIHEALLPETAVLDPELCATMPPDVTLASGLDAASHAMEAVWNRQHSPLTDSLAESALSTLRRSLGRALAEPSNVAVRYEVQIAALLAGLAIGTTQTALAHSISYPFTALFGVPHGLACSFTLADVARFNLEQNPERLAPIARSLGTAVKDVPETIAGWLRELGLGKALSAYLAPAAADCLGDKLITPARSANNIRPADSGAAQHIVRQSLNRLFAEARLKI